MRISGGLVKGRRTATKKSLLATRYSLQEGFRPTSSKVREALFDIIRDRIKGSSFVDLYAGTGTVGLEALSRGADKAIFVEPSVSRIRAVKENAERFGFHERAVVVKGRAYEFLREASNEKQSFDIFFLDPPYYSDEIMKTLPMIGEGRLLNEGSVVIVEHFFKRKLPDVAGELKILKSYRYGDTMLTFYRRKDEI
jgi:16S rRNA (guanine(966)-N(2))-methyltransferase RsmD